MTSAPHVAFATIGTKDTLTGAIIHISGFKFVLAAEPPPDAMGGIFKEENFRPVALRFASSVREKFIMLGWPRWEGASGGKQVNVDWFPPEDTAP